MMTDGKITLSEAVAFAAKRLREAGIGAFRFEAREICAHLEQNGNIEKEKLSALLCRRVGGEPLQYILGEWEFYSLPFYVGPGVLIPRPDTEILCEKGIEFAGERAVRCIDLCSGSGCIAIALEKNCKNAEVYALEKHDDALKYLKKNVALNKSSVKVVKGDITLPGSGEYDLILSNPPYIKSDDIKALSAEVQKEPKTALDGGEDGLYFYRQIIKNYLPCLKSGGMLAVEIGYDQASDVVSLFTEAGLEKVGVKKDFGGNERVVFGTLVNI